MTKEEQAECRGCGLKLIGKPYQFATKSAKHPVTKEECKVNFYGGYVCSDRCDRRVTDEMKRSIDEHVTGGYI